ncbi:hypothetical protein RHMOL_Rhmol09G0077400 [Rhododendron molle]|uniref:Uncharacterized protein n=1 Tax=Rhododendron molle TaxID=49168 RepID=A0ACC0MAZ5_RHOML|nr:hypothetical protein RHMOL_Rhmol09G0077400 [Rhododendron molle]
MQTPSAIGWQAISLCPHSYQIAGEIFQCRAGTSRVVPSTDLGRPNVLWTVQICLGLMRYFGNFILKNYLNRSGPSKTRWDSRDGARHHVARTHPAPKNFSHCRERERERMHFHVVGHILSCHFHHKNINAIQN